MTDMVLLLNQTFNVTGSANIYVKEQPLTVSGRHYGGSGASVVVINSNLLPNASQEYIAATFMHEILHGVLESKGRSSELQQHENIANMYAETMVSSLTTLFQHLTEQSAKALTWDGLQDTNAYANLSQDYKVNLSTVNNSHRSGSDGTKCI